MNNSTSAPEPGVCVTYSEARFIFTSWFSLYLLFLPVFLLVLYIGFRKWRRPQSAAGGLSHSDVFTLHMVLMEMLSIVGSCVVCYGFYGRNNEVRNVGKDAVLTTGTGQILFHSLTCVERYLAVVHPVSYLRLRREGGANIRNICISVVYLLSLIFTLFFRLADFRLLSIINILLSTTPLPLVAYCSVSVLLVLTRPKPGGVAGNRRQMDQSKRSTVYTMAAILGALLLRMVTDIGYDSLSFSPWFSDAQCLIMTSCAWSTLPCSLVLPLLFLQRAGKLSSCK